MISEELAIALLVLQVVCHLIIFFTVLRIERKKSEECGYIEGFIDCFCTMSDMAAKRKIQKLLKRKGNKNSTD